MSDGPIKRERDTWKPVVISTPDAHRVCFRLKTTGPGYCGRTSAKKHSADWSQVSCTDCRAAGRADGVPITLEHHTRRAA